jgi:anaerobic ribonucleoside-triphosphate reductase activating protein
MGILIYSTTRKAVSKLEPAHSSQKSVLNIAAISSKTRALGPGLRAVVWVQGCPLNCPGCLAPNWIPFKPAILVTPAEIYEKLDVLKLDGITFSGGEPMEQAEGLAELANLIRETKDISIICFTGYRYERLINTPPNPGVPKLLNFVDVLIDGPYIQGRNDSIGLRGSSNQRIIHLTSRLRQINLEKQKRTVEVTVSDGELSFVGIPTTAIKSAMDQAKLAATERI